MTAARSNYTALADEIAGTKPYIVLHYPGPSSKGLGNAETQMIVSALRLAASQPDTEAVAREAEMADGCFEAALAEGWADALANGDVERITDLFNRRIVFARNHIIAILSLLSGAGTKSDGGKPLPIETAPRDGTSFIGIATAKGWSATKIARFLHAEDRLPVPEGGGMWPSPPTHWAPLPVVTFIPESDGPPSCADSGDIIAPPAKIPGPSDTPIADSSAQKSAPRRAASHNSGERDPSVMPDCRGADTKSDGGCTSEATKLLRAIWDDIEFAAVESQTDNYKPKELQEETFARLADFLFGQIPTTLSASFRGNWNARNPTPIADSSEAGRGGTTSDLLARADWYVKNHSPDGRGSSLLIMELAAALSAPVGEPYAYHYERATATTHSGKPELWRNELTFGKPDTHKYIRNVVPLYTHPPAPAVGAVKADGVQGSIATKRSSDPEGSSRTETAGGEA